MNYGKLKDRVLSLIRLKKPEVFEATYKEILDAFELKNLDKSKKYLESNSKIKHKWAASQLPWMFTGSVHTTSRIESINSLIKKFVNSSCEISDFIAFLIDFEKKSVYQNTFKPKSTYEEYFTHPLIICAEKEVSSKVADRCSEQLAFSHNYNIRHLKEGSTEEVPVYETKSILATDNTIRKIVRVDNGKEICDCDILEIWTYLQARFRASFD